ncbi:hypothetical protein B0H16DRAFT_1775607 [Mycena metata]|uniref:Zn(2)-C6 fungal-type domain-containing protein n=1 Tax=Mycena metata TaxID=1033252 RepID=A0AAD7HW77_9AGAR|nr:hypothetical protein B0H16DRAFT_1775607 [Mycena metata]
MSVIPPSNPPTSQSSQRKRIYLACVNCRRRKVRCITAGEDTPCQRCVKHGLLCDYVPVSLEREKSLFAIPPGEGSTSTPPSTMPPSWSQAPPPHSAYGHGHHAPPSAPYFNPSHGQPAAPPHFNSVPGFRPDRSHPVPPPFPHPAPPSFPYPHGTNPFPQNTQPGYYPIAQPSYHHPMATPPGFQPDPRYPTFGAAPPTYQAPHSQSTAAWLRGHRQL